MAALPQHPFTLPEPRQGPPDGAGVPWLEPLAIYRSAGLVNEPLAEWLVHLTRWHELFNRTPVYNVTKSLFDRVAAAAALVLLAPLFLVVACLIRLATRGPAFYSQVRIGQYGQPFRIYKFRTMFQGEDLRRHFQIDNQMSGGLFKHVRDPRITRIGRLLRRWSIDELPQLFNVLSGDMSLVGPRPLPPEDTATVPVDCYARFATKPGLTGLWQAIARDSLDGRFKMQLDAQYESIRCWRTDLWLLSRTVPTVLRGIGAF